MKHAATVAAFVLLALGQAGSTETALPPEGESALSSLAEKAMALKSLARTEIDPDVTPLFEHVTHEITSRMAAGRIDLQFAQPMIGGIPTIGRRCATTAPTCGRPTILGCKPRVTLARCFRTTAITCGCPPTTTAPTCGPTLGNCQPPPPPPTTAPNCGQPTMIGCQPRPTMAGCPPVTTAPTCGQPPKPTMAGCGVTTAITCGCRP